MTEVSIDGNVSRCPSCQAELAQGAVLCVACGYHLEKKIRLGTEHAPQETTKKKKKKNKKGKRYLWGILHGGNAMALCTLAGFMLAVILAIVLGIIFAAGNELFAEVGIYVFFGGLVGLAVGGGGGYILASILSHDSSEDISYQLRSGLFTVIDGFVLLGCGLASFGMFREPDKKWGLLIILGSIGLVRMVLGVRAMMPSKSE
jgi:hypothetical protein